MTSLTSQLLTISIISLQRQIYHNRVDSTQNDPFRTLQQTTRSYDYVVVGGGTAGCIVATRLSEHPGSTVLLIEAGGPLTVTSDIVPTFSHFDNIWRYRTTTQKRAAFGIRNRQIFYPRGKILGGSHTINTAAYTRGNKRVFDLWSRDNGARGWSYREVLPYFLRSENNTDPTVVAANPQYHSTSGPVQIVTIPNPDPIILRYIEAAKLMGWPVTDFNGPNQYGIAILQSTQSRLNFTRQTTAAAYIEPNIGRPNFHVMLRSHVTRVLFHHRSTNLTDKPIAYGVEYVYNNQTYQVNATREVVLSGGAINTPQILMLSGVGPRSHLEQHQIPVVADLPVGNNLQDHVSASVDFIVKNQSEIDWSSGANSRLNLNNLYQFLAENYGPLTRLLICETYIATGINGDREWPDGVIFVQITQNDINSTLNNYPEQTQNEWRKYLEQFHGNNHLIVAFSLFRGRSTGTVRLATPNPLDAPLIDPNYFEDNRDLLALIRTASIGLKIVESEYFRSHIENIRFAVPGCAEYRCADRPLSECYQYLSCVAQTVTGSSFHPCCTAPMGGPIGQTKGMINHRASVVDERLRVINIDRLRVVDASVMPTCPNANINAATMMIAEKGSEMIWQDNVQ